jgi:exosortase/archaeosortase
MIVNVRFSKLRELILANRALAWRVLLVPVFVAACYLYDWSWLRVLTTVTLVQISAALGVPMLRSSADVISVAGVTAQFVVACTMIDAFFGAIPLLWRTTAAWTQNVLRLGVVLVAVFALNIFRLELGFIAMTKGVPWWLAHEVVSGLTYFCLYLYIVRERAWDESEAADSKSAAEIFRMPEAAAHASLQYQYAPAEDSVGS